MATSERDYLHRQTLARHNLSKYSHLPEVAPRAGFITTANIPFGNNEVRPSQPLANHLGEFPNTVTIRVPGTDYFHQTILNHVPESQTGQVLKSALELVDNEPDNPLGQLRALGEYFHTLYLERNLAGSQRPPVYSLSDGLRLNCLDPVSANLLFQLAAAEAGFSTNLAFYGLPSLEDKELNFYVFSTFVNPETGAKMVYEPQTGLLDPWSSCVTNSHLPFLGEDIVYQEKSIVRFHPPTPTSP